MAYKRKRRKNPSELISDLIEDIKDDIDTINDAAIKRRYSKELENSVDNIVKMNAESPLTQDERKKIRIGLDNFWKRVQLTHQAYKIGKKWDYFRHTLDGFDAQRFEEKVRELGKTKSPTEVYKEFRPNIPTIMIPNDRLKGMIEDILKTNYNIYERNLKKKK